MKVIVCERTGTRFHGSAAEARADGWRIEAGSWQSPANGWDRHPDAISRDFVAYDGGIDFAAVPLNFGGAR